MDLYTVITSYSIHYTKLYEYFKDQLTGIYNRRFLEEVLIPQTKTFVDMYKNDLVKRENCYAMIIADLDHFKEVNDIYGHSSGDKVIKELGRIFSYVIRPEDYVIRLGGEEFLLILREFDENRITSYNVCYTKLLRKVSDYYNNSIEVDNYEHDTWLEYIKGLESEPEKGNRCLKCFEFSFIRTAKKARELGINYFSSTLTISPHKNSKTIMEIGT